MVWFFHPNNHWLWPYFVTKFISEQFEVKLYAFLWKEKKIVFLLIYESLWQLFLTFDHFFFNRIHTLLLCNSLLPNLSHFQWSIGFSFHFLAKFTKNLENLIERKRLSIQCQLKWLKEQLEYIFWEKITQLHHIILFHFT